MKFLRTTTALIASGTIALSAATSAMAEGKLDIIHWWTSGGELAGIELLRSNIEAQGIEWIDAASAGGAGTNARTLFRTRVQAGDPPAVMQALGTEVNEWAETGILGDLTALAEEEGWYDLVPEPLHPFMNVDGSTVAVPAVWSQINWVWGNKAIFDEHGVAVPQTWDELVAAAETFKAAGITPIAHGGQPWQDTAIFDGILVSFDDPDFYRKVAFEQDRETLEGPMFREAMERLRWYSQQLDEGSPGREWTQAQAMVLNGEAAMSWMGDWAKGWRVAQGQQAGVDFICFPTPGSNDMFVWLADFFFFPKIEGEADNAAQQAFASAVMEQQFQHDFSLIKNGLPVRTDVDNADWDDCTRDSIARAERANARGGLVASLGFAHSARSDVQGVFRDTLSEFVNTPDMSVDEGIEILIDGLDSL
ncbi:ABC transporter substrate-binding protein [Oceanomicrobium pacificus]|uniref:Probable sugar-binding periplasmic protein n=1 Tax=Oceanomicrobium pacificus TaxID=2692916 RepID=A0A6B0TZN8_9RHOB|nr:ABC transporter substrate-binding protein [Oceanomicrobium pacificus]MXU64361.1 extracellular solute-binding protein [Oceanomicrobium pacificus]